MSLEMAAPPTSANENFAGCTIHERERKLGLLGTCSALSG